jgi:hypothetical protein
MIPATERLTRGFDRRRATKRLALVMALAALFFNGLPLRGQQQQSSPPLVKPTVARDFPKEMRGYKLARARVEIKKSKDERGPSVSADADALIQFGEPRIAGMTPLGITMEVPVTVAAVKQGGRVDFLSFEDMVVNGTPVTIEDYMNSFELPNKSPVLLPVPVRVFISTPRALLGALGEWNSSKEVWPVTGRVYVFGHFKKFIFTVKRVVPVELNATLPNPLKNKQTEPTDPAIKQEAPATNP